jgi:hypothetical protein
VSPDRAPRARAARIATELSAIGLALPGTLIERRVRCGKPRCACHADPPALHGPYWQWTRKVAGKTITRIVPDQQVADYQQWIDNDRRLRELVAELEALTLAIADADPRSKHSRQAKHGDTGRRHP